MKKIGAKSAALKICLSEPWNHRTAVASVHSMYPFVILLCFIYYICTYIYFTGTAGSQYQPESLGLGHNGKLTGKYGEIQQTWQLHPLNVLCLFIWFNSSLFGCKGGGEVPYAPQALGFGSEARSAGQYGIWLFCSAVYFIQIIIFLSIFTMFTK